MTCGKCTNQNVDWASYCTQCGEPLGWICNCSFLNNRENNNCGGCGRSLKENHSNKDKVIAKENSYTSQLNHKQLSDLIQESIYFKAGTEEKLDQSDIDNIFVLDEKKHQ